jgi:hypothetical protein
MATAIDVQREILSAALRMSCTNLDADGVFNSTKELYQLFPDLLPNRIRKDEETENFYKLLDLDREAPQSAAFKSYFRATKNFLRQANVQERSQEYYALLNAGAILCNRRLRLSHDLVVAREWLIENNVIAEDTALEQSARISFAPASPNSEEMPVMIAILKQARVIDSSEVQALINQMTMALNDSLEDLILSAGYVTVREMESLQLAAAKIKNKKRILTDEWSDCPFDDGSPPGPHPPNFDPDDSSRVPRRPLPESGSGEIELPLPEPLENNEL